MVPIWCDVAKLGKCALLPVGSGCAPGRRGIGRRVDVDVDGINVHVAGSMTVGKV